MKRSSALMCSSPAGIASKTTQNAAPQQKTAQGPLPLNEDSAGQQAAALLSSKHPDRQAFARLLDDMHEQGVRKLKLCGTRIGPEGYAVLLAEFNQPFRLRDQLREIDFSHTEFPRISTLLQAIDQNHGGRLLSLNLEGTHFPHSPGTEDTDLSRPIGLQPQHLSLVLKIVQGNQGLRYLNLSGQDLLGSAEPRTHPRSFHREAPIYELTQICLKQRIEVLELRNCKLSELDLNDLSHMLSCSAYALSSLRELHLQGNDARGSHDWIHFIRQARQHRTLERLSLPDAAYDQHRALSDQQKQALAQCVASCTRLCELAPSKLANTPELYAVLWKRREETRQAQFMNATMSLWNTSVICKDNLALVMTEVARLEGMDPAQVLPTRLVHAAPQGKRNQTP